VPDQRWVTVRGRIIGTGREPLICLPLVGGDRAALLSELAAVMAKKPDLIEWRVDHFLGIGDSEAVLAAGAEIRHLAGDIPLLFTVRSAGEGGRPTPLAGDGVVNLYARVCAGGNVDLVDFELAHDPVQIRMVRKASLAGGVKMILSFHDFTGTPGAEVLRAKCAAAESAGADMVKIAVMPHDPGDVLALLSVTWEESRRLAMPLITMAMGPLGTLTRLAGWLFGSSVTFAVGAHNSAPGQVPVEDLRVVLDVMRRYTGITRLCVPPAERNLPGGTFHGD